MPNFTAQLFKQFFFAASTVTRLQVNPTNEDELMAATGNVLRILDISDSTSFGTTKHVLKTQQAQVADACFLPNGSALFGASHDKTLALYACTNYAMNAQLFYGHKKV